MATEEVTGAIGGAAKGAAIGAAVGGPVGAVVGGIIGGIGGLFGGKSKKYKKKARKEEQKIERTAIALDRKNIILEGYIQRQRAVASAAAQDEGGGLMSSPGLGAIGSIGSQLQFNLNYFGQQTDRLTLRDKYLKKAGKYAGYADLAGTVLDVGSSIYNTASLFGGPSSVTKGSNTKSPIPSSYKN